MDLGVRDRAYAVLGGTRGIVPPRGVRANCVCPGATETDILAGMRRSMSTAAPTSEEHYCTD